METNIFNNGTNVFLDLENYNSTLTEIPSTLKYSGNNFLDVQTKVWVYKFTMNTNNYPLYIPTIIQNFVPFNLNTNTETIIDNPNNYYMTDWAITIKYYGLEANNYVSVSKTTPVLWQKYGMKQAPIDLLNTKYFWIENSDQICDMINSAFSAIFGDNVCYCTKTADRWSLLLNILDTNIETIHFNDAMKQFFSFNYGLQNGISIAKMQTYTIDSNTYNITTTTTTNNKLFIFDKLIFKSEQLNVPQLQIQDFSSGTTNYSSATILSYDLNISDISVLGNSISFTSECKDRSLSLLTPVLPSNFTIIPYFVTKSGDTFSVKLKTGEKLSFSMMFF